MNTKYRWSNSLHDPVIKIFVCLNNSNTKQIPLRDDDKKIFNRVKNRCIEISDALCKKRKLTQEIYREGRNRFMNMRFRSMDDSNLETVYLQ